MSVEMAEAGGARGEAPASRDEDGRATRAERPGPNGRRRLAARWVRIGLAVVAGIAAGVLGRLALKVVAAWLLGGLAVLLGWLLALAPSSDPVYTRAALNTLANLHFTGIAVASPAGDWLHASLPGWFLTPALANGVPARLVAASGSAVLARLAATTLAFGVLMGVAVWLLRAGLTRRRTGLIGLSLGVQLQLALAVIGLPPSLANLEAAGVSFAVTAAFPFLGRRTALSDLVAGWPPEIVSGLLVGLALLIAYLAGELLLFVVGHLVPLVARNRPALTHWFGRPSARAFASSLAVAVLLAGGSAAIAGERTSTPARASHLPRKVAVAQAAVAAQAVAPDTAAQTANPTTAPASAAYVVDDSGPLRPSHVEIVQVGPQAYQYLVNGQPQVIRGMGLNTQYATKLSPAARAQRLEADFSLMQAMGINTVLGWDPAEFQAPLLDVADRHGIGVVLPFDLDPNADYTDPTVRAQLTAQVLAWVQANRGAPALRMWGLGNEVLHKIVHPSWVGPQDPASERQARAFADWLIATADAIHQVDPDHPITYREAEDAFIPWIADAIQRTHTSHPWFVFGTNCYSNHLKDIVDGWPDLGMPGPVWVSEEAPGGEAPADRAGGFAEMWGYVRERPNWVLGGAVYAWTQDGPEEIDRTMGITNDGQIVDQDWIDMLTSLFTTDAPPAQNAASAS